MSLTPFHNIGALTPLAEKVGSRIEAIHLGEALLSIKFCGGDVVDVFDNGQDCCEVRSMTCDDDLSYHVGSTFLGVEIANSPNIDDPAGEVHEVQFLRIATSLGVITIANHNEHNGYYGGFDVVAKLVQGGAQ